MRSWFNRLLKIRRKIVRAYLKFRRVPGYKYVSEVWPWLRIDAREESAYEIRYLSRKICTTLPVKSLCDNPDDVAIIGSGPSVKRICPEKTATLKCVLVNGAVKLVEMWGLNPLATVIIDQAFVEKRIDLLGCLPPGSNLVLTPGVVRAISERQPRFLGAMKVYLTQDLAKPVYDAGSRSYPERDESGRAIFSFDLDHGYVDGGTVIGAALQLVHQMGARNTYIVGMDMSTAVGPRFYETEANGLKCLLDEEYDTKILPFMMNAARIFRRDNRAVYNCSPISKLPYEVFPYFDGLALAESKR